MTPKPISGSQIEAGREMTRAETIDALFVALNGGAIDPHEADGLQRLGNDLTEVTPERVALLRSKVLDAHYCDDDRCAELNALVAALERIAGMPE